jgi:hypothetical protein
LHRCNFPQAKVYTQDLNLCAKNALTPEGIRKEIKSLDTTDADAPKHMPSRGEVGAIFAGPPWFVVQRESDVLILILLTMTVRISQFRIYIVIKQGRRIQDLYWLL